MQLQRMETDAFRILVNVTRVLCSETLQVKLVLRQGWTQL